MWSVLPMVGFGAAVLPICLTPGVSFALVTDRAITRGVSSAAGVITGTLAGLFTHAALAAAGLSAIVMRSAEAFIAVKLAGAIYLILLGAWMLAKSVKGYKDTTATKLPWARGGDIAQGYFGNVLNPKAAAVYLTLAPQFLNSGSSLASQMFGLWIAHALVGGGWLAIWVGVVATLHRKVDLAQYRSWFHRLGGVVMIGLGVHAAAK